MPWFQRRRPTHACMSFGNCHVGIEQHDGRWYFDVGIQYWTLFRIPISESDARDVMSRYVEIEGAMNVHR